MPKFAEKSRKIYKLDQVFIYFSVEKPENQNFKTPYGRAFMYESSQAGEEMKWSEIENFSAA